MDILKLVWAAAMACGMIIPAKRALHMFQQNRYEVKRYTKWIRESLNDNVSHAVTEIILVVLSGMMAVFLKAPMIIVAEIAVCNALIQLCLMKEKKKNYIKPLVYTARVKRQIAVMAVLAAITVAVIVIFDVYGLSGFGCFVLPWVLIYLMAAITSPIEAAVRQHFIRDAKRILKEHHDLVSIGITGSFGKTTTKNIMQAVLSEQFNSLMTPASYNTPMGITITIRTMLKPIHQVFVCEMGADKVGDITELMNFVHPSIGVVTSVGPQHLNTFGSQENITREKMQMIELLPKDGFGILNYDNEFIRNYQIKNPVKYATYGVTSRDVDYYADEIVYTQTGSSFVIVHGEERIPFETKLLGEHNILNILSAVACARHLGVSWKVTQRAVKAMKQVEHRLELKTINGYRFIDDAFNANPTGAKMALEVLGRMPNKRYIVTPGMIDLGPKQAEINHTFGTQMKGNVDTVILVGKTQTKPIAEGLKDAGFDMNNVIVFDTVKEAFAYVYQNADRKDTILLENDLPDAFSH